MIARHRGDQRIHSRWRPGGGAITRAPALRTQAEHIDELDLTEGRRRPTYPIHSRRFVGADRRRRRDRRRGSRKPTPGLVGPAARRCPRPQGSGSNSGRPPSLENPGRECRQLFAPSLAGVFKADTGRSCLDYYNDVNAKSFQIRYVLERGGCRGPLGRPETQLGYVTMILSHVEQGWQAVDIVPGGPVRPR